MSMGSNIPLTAPAVRASLRWSARPGVPAVDASALLLDASGNVARDDDFVFYNQPEHPSGAVRMAGRTDGPQASDQIDVDLQRVPAATTRIVLAASADGGTFGQVPDLELVLLDLAGAQVLASFPMQASTETAFVSAEIYRRNEEWKFRAVGQGYASGLAGLAADFGIDATGADTSAAGRPGAPAGRGAASAAARACAGGTGPTATPARGGRAAAPTGDSRRARGCVASSAVASSVAGGRPPSRDPGYDPLLDLS